MTALAPEAPEAPEAPGPDCAEAGAAKLMARRERERERERERAIYLPALPGKKKLPSLSLHNFIYTQPQLVITTDF